MLSVWPVRSSSRRSACRSSTASETSATAPPSSGGSPERGVCDRTERDRDRAAADDAVDDRNHGREGEELLAPLRRHRGIIEHPAPVVVSGEQEEPRLLAGDLLVVVADPIDRHPVAEVLRAALDHAHEGEHAEHVQASGGR